MSYKAQLKTRRFKYDADRDNLQRGISVLIELGRWQVWIMIISTSILAAFFVGVIVYLLLTV